MTAVEPHNFAAAAALGLPTKLGVGQTWLGRNTGRQNNFYFLSHELVKVTQVILKLIQICCYELSLTQGL
jgi:hypothetical protein